MKIISLIFSLLITVNAFSSWSSKCTDYDSPIDWSYCLHTNDTGNSDQLLYHFHGKGGSEMTWAEKDFFAEDVRKAWDKNKVNPPKVVSISLGTVWVLAKKNGSPYSGLFELMAGKIIPLIEKTERLAPSKRLLVGNSMGGLNASAMLLNLPRLFSKVALVCPAISPLTPESSSADVDKYILDTGASRDRAELLVQLTKLFTPTLSDWKTNSPLVQGPKLLTKNSSELYIS